MHLIRTMIVLGVVSAATLSVRGLPVLPLAGSSHVTVAADREVVRNAYNGLTGVLGQAAVNAVPVANLLASLPSIASFGAGGGGGFGPMGVPSMGLPVVIKAPAYYSFAIPQSGGTYFSLFNTPPQSNVVIGAVQVPDAGMTALLLAGSLLVLFLLHRFVPGLRLAMVRVRH